MLERGDGVERAVARLGLLSVELDEPTIAMRANRRGNVDGDGGELGCALVSFRSLDALRAFSTAGSSAPTFAPCRLRSLAASASASLACSSVASALASASLAERSRSCSPRASSTSAPTSGGLRTSGTRLEVELVAHRFRVGAELAHGRAA